MHAMKVAVVAGLALLASAQDPSPTWGPSFLATFEEKTLKGESTGYFALDLDYPNGGAQAIFRQDGSADRICSAFQEQPHQSCAHVAVGANRYILWPDTNKCCICCSREQGCGPLNRHWVQNATFLGTAEVNGQSCNSWSIKGFQMNYLLESVESPEKVCLLSNAGIDNMTFSLSSWSPTVDPKYFSVPTNCTERCGYFLPCTPQ
eukprot:TRINITY_DN6169_c0_g1_i1.p1 TRINITY_DN6169_c0_g1~~TRINITY_DN6169_c0_g1_i1.p1  ORF type:complete len:205 (-),score=40.25 TRINITY_DN6169_c0_g1_i1:27-641(-)